MDKLDSVSDSETLPALVKVVPLVHTCPERIDPEEAETFILITSSPTPAHPTTHKQISLLPSIPS